jgi:hypothetical protein
MESANSSYESITYSCAYRYEMYNVICVLINRFEDDFVGFNAENNLSREQIKILFNLRHIKDWLVNNKFYYFYQIQNQKSISDNEIYQDYIDFIKNFRSDFSFGRLDALRNFARDHEYLINTLNDKYII